jgi:hypothetical protein
MLADHGRAARIRAMPSAVFPPVGIRGGWLGQPLGLLALSLLAGCAVPLPPHQRSVVKRGSPDDHGREQAGIDRSMRRKML